MFLFLILIWNRKNIKRNREFLHASIEGQEQERKRLAENLHDDIGPLLSALKLQIKSSKIEQSKMNDINATLNQTVTSLRNISMRMSPAVLEELGLNQALQHACHNFRRYSDIELNLTWEEEIENVLAKKYQIHLYRIVREAMNNALKHSNATNLNIKGEIINKNILRVMVKDNGQGSINHNSRIEGLGLKNIRARAEAMSGRMLFNSSKQGTTVKIEIPVVQHD